MVFWINKGFRSRYNLYIGLKNKKHFSIEKNMRKLQFENQQQQMNLNLAYMIYWMIEMRLATPTLTAVAARISPLKAFKTAPLWQEKALREKTHSNRATAFVFIFFKLPGPKISTCCGSLQLMGL